MGKRRKPTRKPSYQSLGEINSGNLRMSGDELVAFMNEIPDRELGPTYERLLDITDKMNQRDQMFIDAGVPASEFQGFQQLQVPQLSNGVPAPYIDKQSKRGLERRVHTQVMQNPKTGGREITPIPNPETKQALVTEFGDGRTGRIDGLNVPSNPRQVGQRASELLGKHIMWLQGDSGARLVNTSNYSIPDMLSGDGRGIDTHTLRTRRHDGVVEIQVNTGINPTIAPRGSSNEAVKQMIHEQLDNGSNIVQAIENLKGMTRGGVTPMRLQHGAAAGKDVSAGKLVKEGYDGLISPVFNESEALLNVNTATRGGQRLTPNMQDKQVLKPESIYSIDLAKVRDAIYSMSPAQQKEIMQVIPNKGNGGRGIPRSRVNVDVPVSTSGVTDISNEGYVAQLLRNLQYA
jgi:hypothetical protein